MKVAIRVDASVHIGSGHIMRCLVLATGLRGKGHSISFICRPQAGDMISFLKSKHQLVHVLPELALSKIPNNTSDYAAWLQVDWQQDAEDVLAFAGGIDLMVVDHYGINRNWEHYVKSTLGCRLFAIDDLVREHDADLILDQTLLRKPNEYQVFNSSSSILSGCDYALIKPEFSQLRQLALGKQTEGTKLKLLLTMGAIDQFNITLQVLQVFAAEIKDKPDITVILGQHSPYFADVRDFCRLHDWVTHIDFTDNMPALMLQHDIAVGAPGSTTWERACLGIPSILIPLAENQQTICHSMCSIDAAISLSKDEIASHFASAYRQLINNLSFYQKQNLDLCDGLGLERVITVIEQLSEYKCNIQLRQATTADIDVVYQWQCQPGTRKFALNPTVPSLFEHQQWMRNKLQSTNDYFYIITSGVEKTPVGVLRLDLITDQSYTVSIFIDEMFYGRGIAKQALLNLDILHRNITIKAQVLSDNSASQRLFSSAGYLKHSTELFIRQPLSDLRDKSI